MAVKRKVRDRPVPEAGERARGVGTGNRQGKREAPGEAGTKTRKQPAPADKSDKPWTGPFTGRYRQGPEKAVYRIVLYTDYQCPDCFKVEDDIVQLMKTRSDISLSTKHFPFDKDCNPNMSMTLHGGACLAASMAEAAGLLNGNDGFWADAPRPVRASEDDAGQMQAPLQHTRSMSVHDGPRI